MLLTVVRMHPDRAFQQHQQQLMSAKHAAVQSHLNCCHSLCRRVCCSLWAALSLIGLLLVAGQGRACLHSGRGPVLHEPNTACQVEATASHNRTPPLA